MAWYFIMDGDDLLKPTKVKVKVKFTLEQATRAQRGSRRIALLFLQPWR
jgi:hypothetical protein